VETLALKVCGGAGASPQTDLKTLQVIRAGHFAVRKWWVVTGSNRRHSRCKRDALPTELTTRKRIYRRPVRFHNPFFRNLYTASPLLGRASPVYPSAARFPRRCKRVAGAVIQTPPVSMNNQQSPQFGRTGPKKRHIFRRYLRKSFNERCAVTTQFSPALPKTSTRFVPILFTITIFISASLLFFVQPLFTRIVLPSIGGASAVWTTAMLFFQSVLIAGYFYAHLTTRYLPVRWQMGLHLALWAIALWFLPLALPDEIRFDTNISPALHTLILYALGVGMPFVVLSANAPLIQSWYGRSGGPSADDPYFLYGASNLGSLISLLAFPLIAEPLFGISAIGKGWAVGFVILGGLLLACVLVPKAGAAAAAAEPTLAANGPAAKPRLRDFATWALLAFIPSSLMLGVTSKISTDLGSFPLVWVIPLALYLLTFVITFTSRPLFGANVLTPLFRASMAILVVLSAGGAAPDNATWIVIALLMASYFIVSTKAHSVLFNCRPSKEHLTLFYVTMSVGGALGGVFNSLLAPMIFNDIYELRIMVAIAAILLVAPFSKVKGIDVAFGVVLALIAVQPFLLLYDSLPNLPVLVRALAGGAILFGGYIYLSNRSVAPMIATAVTVAFAAYVTTDDAIFKDRSFFGAHKIQEMGGFRRYVHGTTIHGAERMGDYGKRPEPITYYSLGGPMGQIFTSARGKQAKTVGIVGLGVGALACYRQDQQTWDFYEIDKTVDDIARNANYFTYMSTCAGSSPTYLGDARIVLDHQADKRFDILVIDAYSSDAVPVHLTTTEAVQLYKDRLAPGGLLIFHISNRFFDIELPLARSAEALGMPALMQNYEAPLELAKGGDFSSRVVVMGALQDLAQDSRWAPLKSDGGALWTDDYANPLSIMR
jgi:spermidine synthase